MLLHEILNAGENDKVALIYKGQKITYKELRKNINSLRSYLYSNGVKQGDRIGLFYKNSPEFIYSYFAVISLGAVIVPFNIMLTPRELEYMINDADISLVITMQKLDINTKQLVIPETPDIFTAKTEIPNININENAESTIIYTSGTTGTPKGAVLTHKNLVANTISVCEEITITDKDNFLTVLPCFHSFAWTVTVSAPLSRGGTITIMEIFNPGEALRNIAEYKVTVVAGVPAMFNFYYMAGTKEMFDSVRIFICGGASLPSKLFYGFKEKFGLTIMEGYGLSEASPVVTFNPLDKSKPGSIGTPLNGVEVKIVKHDGNETDINEVGELLVRGDNVMKGYLNMPEVNAKTIVDNWLHTGDLAYKDDEGYIFIADRLKDMIIVSGLNVYSKEVEDQIAMHPDVAEVAVVGASDEKRGEVVCAYIVLKEGKELDKKTIQAFLRENLASYKIPKNVYFIEKLPKNALGKVLKHELKNN